MYIKLITFHSINYLSVLYFSVKSFLNIIICLFFENIDRNLYTRRRWFEMLFEVL